MLSGWIRTEVGNALVQREEDAAIAADVIEESRIMYTCEGFIVNRVGLMAGGTQVLAQLSREVLVQLDLHAGRRGRRLSSRASS
jgi:hypothetical protein